MYLLKNTFHLKDYETSERKYLFNLCTYTPLPYILKDYSGSLSSQQFSLLIWVFRFLLLSLSVMNIRLFDRKLVFLSCPLPAHTVQRQLSNYFSTDPRQAFWCSNHISMAYEKKFSVEFHRCESKTVFIL